MISRRVVTRVAVFCTLFTAGLTAQEPRLGHVDFPTSGSGAAQQHFLRGALYLHSFEYESAASAFREAQRADSGFAMAYWGEAMTSNHSLWGEWDDAAARAVLQRLGPTPEARAARAATHREQMYLAAVEALWAPGPKPQRDTAYSEAMEALVRAHPDDDEARAFYALSLLGLSGTTRVVPTYMRGGAIAMDVFARHPDHPGGAHYVIHAFDDPVHAPLGLPAARAYSKIAPDAAHAQHMTTHIFLALGMWPDVVSQNVLAANLTGWGPGHYTQWLHYGLLQGGKPDDARALLERARREMGSPGSPHQRGTLVTMRAHQVVNAERWDDPSLAWAIDTAGTGDIARAIDAFITGYAAVRRGDAATARVWLPALQHLAAATPGQAPAHPGQGEPSNRIGVMALELEAVTGLAAGRPDQAIALLRKATAMEQDFPAEYGPPDIVKPSHELLGEVLLDLGRPADAQEAFEGALALAPNRALSLRGLERAARAAGDEKTAQRAAALLAESRS